MIEPAVGPALTNWVVGLGANLGIRRIFKFASGKWLRSTESQVAVDVAARGHAMNAATMGRYPILFRVEVMNAAPIDIRLVAADFSITYEDVEYVPHAEVALPVTVPRQTLRPPVWVEIIYMPYTSILGIPRARAGWRLQGRMIFECYWGRFEKQIGESGILTVECTDTVWEEARADYERRLETARGV